MVKITNGVDVFEVTRGALDGIYSRQGFKIVIDEAAKSSVNAPEKTEDEIFMEEILEKPISQWSKDEIKRFAAIIKIDISGTKNASEAKEIIKSVIDGE